MIYLAGWGGLYFALTVSFLSGYRGRFFGFLAIFCISSIAVFRGSTGTDTANYELILSGLSSEAILGGLEPGFVLASIFLVDLFGSADVALRGLSLLFFVLVALYYSRADINESFVLMVYLAPAYFYTYSMNGVRIGLASVLLLLAAQEFRKGRILRSGAVVLAAVSFHYTILFSIGYFLSVLFNKVKIKYVFFFSVMLLLFFYSASEYILLKLTVYSDFKPPSPLSGLSKVVVIFVLICGVVFSSLSFIVKVRIFFPAVFFSALAIAVTTISYAGLRLLDLVAFILPLTVLMSHASAGLIFNWKIKASIFLAGFLSMAAVYRSFLIESGQGDSPFLPYKFINDGFIFNLL